jgi:hypothetical protein
MYNSSLDKRPRRNPVPTTKLLDTNNTERAGLPFQLKFIADHRAARKPEVRDASTGTSSENADATSNATSTTTQTHQIPDTTSSPEPSGRIPEKRPFSAVDDSDTKSDSEANLTDHPVQSRNKIRL